jgi:Ca2+-binding RTX toxin-like protein
MAAATTTSSAALAAASGFDLADNINGGKGSDSYDASGTDDAVNINLDKVSHNGGAFAMPTLAAHSASGVDISGTFTDQIFNFESAHGGDNSDLIYGTAGANVIFGGGGLFDELFGFGGNDKLFGEFGFDLLVGGRGRDTLTGGTEGDIFAYSSIADSGPGKAARDVITDYEDGTDRIDLSRIDANTKIAGDQPFNFLGTDVAFSGHRGDLRVHSIGGGFLIEGDVNGDKKVDFVIEIVDPDHSTIWSNTPGDDFDF